MSLPLNDSFQIYRGDTFSRRYQIASGSLTSNVPTDLTGAAINSQLRKSETAPGNPVASFTVGSRVDLQGQFTLSLTSAQTAALPIGDLVFDIQIISGGVVTTYVVGSVDVVSDVTRE